MPISFNEVPANHRIPGFYAEIDSSRAIQGAQLKPYRALLIGQKLSGGTVAELVPTRITSAAQASAYFGVGSMLHGMAEAYFAGNQFTETWAVAIDDAAGATASEGTLAFTGPATAAGTVFLMVAGRRITVGVASGATATAVGAAVAAAITARTDLPVTAAADTGTVTVTAKNAGAIGDEIDLRLNYFTGEALPAGLGCTVTPMGSGAGVVDLGEVWPTLGDEQFDVIANPYTDAANLTELEGELASRWAATRAIEGFALSATSAAHATAITLGDSRNSRHVSIMSSYGSPSPVWEWAASVCATVGFFGAADPARPFQTLPLVWVKAEALSARFTDAERNLLLFDGISTHRVTDGGGVVVERVVTTYQTGAFGADDASYLDANTPLTLGFLRWSLRGRFLLRYPRHKLADDGARFGAGQAVVTPLTAKAEVIAWARDLEELGLIENLDQFANDVLVERNPTDPNRLDVQLSPDLVNQARLFGAKLSFIL